MPNHETLYDALKSINSNGIQTNPYYKTYSYRKVKDLHALTSLCCDYNIFPATSKMWEVYIHLSPCPVPKTNYHKQVYKNQELDFRVMVVFCIRVSNTYVFPKHVRSNNGGFTFTFTNATQHISMAT